MFHANEQHTLTAFYFGHPLFAGGFEALCGLVEFPDLQVKAVPLV